MSNSMNEDAQKVEPRNKPLGPSQRFTRRMSQLTRSFRHHKSHKTSPNQSTIGSAEKDSKPDVASVSSRHLDLNHITIGNPELKSGSLAFGDRSPILSDVTSFTKPSKESPTCKLTIPSNAAVSPASLSTSSDWDSQLNPMPTPGTMRAKKRQSSLSHLSLIERTTDDVSLPSIEGTIGAPPSCLAAIPSGSPNMLKELDQKFDEISLHCLNVDCQDRSRRPTSSRFSQGAIQSNELFQPGCSAEYKNEFYFDHETDFPSPLRHRFQKPRSSSSPIIREENSTETLNEDSGIHYLAAHGRHSHAVMTSADHTDKLQEMPHLDQHSQRRSSTFESTGLSRSEKEQNASRMSMLREEDGANLAKLTRCEEARNSLRRSGKIRGLPRLLPIV